MVSPQEITQTTQIEISPLQESDIAQLVPILHEHVRDSDTHLVQEGEITDIVSWMRGQPDEANNHRIRSYFVARDINGQVLGCIGITKAATYHLIHHQTIAADTAELVNFFVTSTVQGRGVGRKLFNQVLAEARNHGKKYLVLDSGPRYEHSWPIYDKLFGNSGTTIQNLYGPGYHARTWKIDL